jgi:hypothetical protein
MDGAVLFLACSERQGRCGVESIVLLAAAIAAVEPVAHKHVVCLISILNIASTPSGMSDGMRAADQLQ